jgi:nitrite reductase/ring-hydroxylating ferredoxin subunit
MSRYVVATVDEIAPGSCKLATIKGREIGVFNVAGAFYAIANRCPHAGGPMCRGTVGPLVRSTVPGEYRLERDGEFLRCPWHGWEFDIKTGQSWCDPSRIALKTYAAKAEPGTEVVKGPYVAETFKVNVEKDYVVVEV